MVLGWLSYALPPCCLAVQVRYLVEPPPPGADPRRAFKYPFAACEIFCCEVPGLLGALNLSGGRHAQRFWSLWQRRPA
jgi:hypothetical protein